MLAPQNRGDWFWLPAPRPDARLRLFCFPHAGGDGPAFAALGQRLPDDIEVSAIRMPGRGGRFNDPVPTTFDDLVGTVADAMRPWLDRPFAVLGQSIGGLVAYEIARTLHPTAVPSACFIASFAPPASWQGLPGLADAEQEELITFLHRTDGRAAEVLAHPGLGALAVRALAADMNLIRSYQRRDDPVLTCPVHALIGTEDESVSEAGVRRWSECTSGPFTLSVIPGGHLVMQTGAPVVAAVTDTVGHIGERHRTTAGRRMG